MSFTVFPSVDIFEGRCLRPLQGRFGTERVYSDDPVRVATGFARAGARWLHIVDLEGARTGVPANRDLLLEVVRRASCPVQAGGGLRDVDDVEEVLAAGASRAVIGTFALEDPAAVRKAGARFGERITMSLEARSRGEGPDGWSVGAGLAVEEAIARSEEAGVSQFVYTDLSRDGKMTGPDLAGLLRVTRETSLPVVASGGISSLEEVAAVARLHRRGITGAIVGRALYDNKFTVGEANYAADEVVSSDAGEEVEPD